jgi:hypothetical protein
MSESKVGMTVQLFTPRDGGVHAAIIVAYRENGTVDLVYFNQHMCYRQEVLTEVKQLGFAETGKPFWDYHVGSILR